MKTIGRGTYEIRIKESGNEYRVYYVAKFGDTIYVPTCLPENVSGDAAARREHWSAAL